VRFAARYYPAWLLLLLAATPHTRQAIPDQRTDIKMNRITGAGVTADSWQPS